MLHYTTDEGSEKLLTEEIDRGYNLFKRNMDACIRPIKTKGSGLYNEMFFEINRGRTLFGSSRCWKTHLPRK